MTLFGSRALWSISIPLLFAEVSEVILQLTDSLFLARVGIHELGAIAVADSAIELALVPALGLVDGIQILVARHIGGRRPRRAVALFHLGLAAVAAVSVALALPLALGGDYLFGWLVESEEVSTAVKGFVGIAVIGMPFTAACFAYSALLVGFGRTGVLIPATILLTVSNALLDYILIFGKLGFAPMGIRGAAIGTVTAEVLTFLFLTIYLITRPEARRLGLFRRWIWSVPAIRRLMRLSGPISLQGIVEAVRWFVFFLILERIGAAALAVANVVYTCYSVFRIPTEAFGETVCSMVSRLVGRGQPDRIDRVVRQAIAAAGLVSIPFLIGAFVAPEWILSAFALPDDLLQTGAMSLRVVVVAMLIVIPAEMWFTAILATGDTPAALGIEVLLTIVMIGLAYVAAIAWGGNLALTWCSLGVAWLVTLFASYGWMKSGKWRRLAY